MIKKLLTVVGACFVGLSAEPDLEIELRNESGHRLYVVTLESNYSVLSEEYSIPGDEIENGKTFDRSIVILRDRYYDSRLRKDNPNKITFEIEDDSSKNFSITWDLYSSQISCPKGYKITQSRDASKFLFVLRPDRD